MRSSDWQPISTAPHGAAGKPDTYVMLSKQEQGTTLVCTGYVNVHGAYEWFGGGMMGLTHWMPLPGLPAISALAGMDKPWRDPSAEQMTFDQMAARAQYEWQRAEDAEKEALEINRRLELAAEALGRIAAGDGYYGAQAREYKDIARAALRRITGEG